MKSNNDKTHLITVRLNNAKKNRAKNRTPCKRRAAFTDHLFLTGNDPVDISAGNINSYDGALLLTATSNNSINFLWFY